MWNMISCKSEYKEYLVRKETKHHKKHLEDIKLNINNPRTKSISQPKRILKENRRADTFRNQEINFENKALIKRMLKIDLNPKKPQKSSSIISPIKSLNDPMRRQFQESVQNSNRLMLKKLRKTESVYSIAKWKESNKFHQYIRNNISRNSGRLIHKKSQKKQQILNESHSLESFEKI